MNKKESFASRLVMLRTEKKLSQYKLADILNLSRGQISNYEQGSREPDYDTIKLFAEYFDVSIDYLLCCTDNRKGIIQSDEGINPDNIKYKTYQQILDKFLSSLAAEGIIAENELPPKEAVELLYKHGAQAAIEIMKLKKNNK